MNCKQIQQGILERLAAGESILPLQFLTHQQSCADCRNYYERQIVLFHSMEQGLGRIANSPVPPSLLPVVRARLDGQAAVRSFRLFGWPMAALTTSALVAAAFGLFWHRPRPVPPAPEIAQTSTPIQNSIAQNSTAPIPPEAKTTRKTPHHVGRPHDRSITSAAAEEATPYVMVLAEEREAFSRFIAQVPENPAAALALTHPAPQGDESPVEIASLKIESLEVRPLESSE